MYLQVHQGSAPNYCAGGACYLCKTSPYGNWVKTSIDVFEEGEFVICEACVAEIARLLRYISPAQAEKLRESNRLLGAENKRLKGAEERLKVVTEAVKEAVGD